jgi:hypothetical protein
MVEYSWLPALRRNTEELADVVHVFRPANHNAIRIRALALCSRPPQHDPLQRLAFGLGSFGACPFLVAFLPLQMRHVSFVA